MTAVVTSDVPLSFLLFTVTVDYLSFQYNIIIGMSVGGNGGFTKVSHLSIISSPRVQFYLVPVVGESGWVGVLKVISISVVI